MQDAFATTPAGVAMISSTVTVRGRTVMHNQSANREQRHRSCLHRIRLKDSEALAQLYDDTANLLYSLAVRILSDTADAEEVVLDVYQHVWNSAHTFDETRGSVGNWLAILT